MYYKTCDTTRPFMNGRKQEHSINIDFNLKIKKTCTFES